MKPGFALSLSVDGISLLHRAAGGWRRVGDVSLETEDLSAALAELRAQALRLEPGGIACKVVLPNEQIRYLTIETGDVEDDELVALTRAALDGETPYAVDELAFDFSTEGDVAHIAATARETLEEAESFALEHGFNPVSFVAIPGDNPFLGEPFFGTARSAAALPGGDRVEPDGIAVVVIGAARLNPPPAPEPEDPALAEAPPHTASGAEGEVLQESPARHAPTEPEAAPAADTGEADGTVPPDPAPAAGFASRRAGTGAASGAPALAGARRAPADVAPRPAPATLSPAQGAAIAAPGLAVPEPAEDAEAEPPAAGRDRQAAGGRTQRTGVAAFLTRRGTGKPARSAAPAVAITRVAPEPIRRPEPGSAEEAEQMTIFGARQPKTVGGKPRHLGLVLTVVLLLFLAAVAAWAAVFQEGVIARLLFGAAPPTTERAIAPDTATPDTAPRAAPGADDAEPAPPASEPPTSALTPSDEVVLDALRNPEIAALLNPDAAEARYDATGIWQQPPAQPEPPASDGTDDIYVASIDRTALSQDAVALPPAAGLVTDISPATPGSPAAAGTTFTLDARGLVTPSPEGTLSPEGFLVHLGRPPVIPPEPPDRVEAAPEPDTAADHLAGLRPRPRPENLVELSERQQLGGRSRAELGGLRPKPRPDAVVQAAEAASRQAEAARKDAEAAALAAEVARKQAEDAAQASTAQAIATSRPPEPRPSDFASLVRRAETSSERSILPTARQQFGRDRNLALDPESEDEPEPDSGSVAPRTVKPSAPSSSTVARQATLDNAINLRQMNLIGVYGTPSNRRALVRLSNGRYKKVKVGDSIDGGRIVAIGDSELRYQKGGRNLTLKIPSG